MPVEAPTKFGQLIEAGDLQDAVQKTIEDFIEDYLAEYERQHELAPKTIPVIQTYTQVNEFRNWGGNQTPVCVIVSPGLNEPPAKKGGGEYTGMFDLGIAIIVQANERKKTNRLARRYGAIIRQLLLQQGGLGGIASGINFEDERYNDVLEGEDRAQASAQVVFTVEVPSIVNGRKGIKSPSEDPYEEESEAPEAVESSATIEKKDEVGP